MPTESVGTLRYTSGADDVATAVGVTVEAFLVELPWKDVGGGVEIETLAPVCADTCNAQVKEITKANTVRQSIFDMIPIVGLHSERAQEKDEVSS